MKRLAILFAALALLCAGPALAQNCGGQPSGNTVCASPSGGGGGFPSFRALVSGDFPASGVGAGTFGSSTQCVTLTVNAKGVVTGASAATCTPAFSSITATPTTLAGYGITNARTLVINPNYYVNGNSGSTAACGPAGGSTCSAGSDSNNCLTPGTACLTAQHALNLILSGIDFGGSSGNIYLAHNAGTANYAVSCALGPLIGTSVINIVGDSSAPTTTVMTGAANSPIASIKDGCTLDFQYVVFADNGTNNVTQSLSVGGTGNAGHADITTVQFNALAIGTHMAAGNMGSITFVGPITIAGGAPVSMAASDGGLIDTNGQTVTISGTPAFSTAFAFIPNGGVIKATNTTFSGAATGTRCQVNGPMNLGGFNPNNVFPGNANCVGQSYHGAIGLQNGSTFAYGTGGQPLCSGGASNAVDTWCNLGIAAGGTGLTTGSPRIVGPAINVNFGVAGDNSLSVPLPSGYTRLCSLQFYLSGASANISTGTFGIFTAASGGGTAAITAGTTTTITTNADNTNNNFLQINANNITTQSYLPTANTLFFRVGTTVAGTVNVQASYVPCP